MKKAGYWMMCCCLVTKSQFFCNSMDCSPPSLSVHEIFQARILELVAISFSRGSFLPRDWTHVSCIAGIGKHILYHWATQGMTCVAFVVQSLSHARLFATSWTAAHQASLFFSISQSLLKLMSIESVTPSNHLILCCPRLLLPSVFPSIRIFS